MNDIDVVKYSRIAWIAGARMLWELRVSGKWKDYGHKSWTTFLRKELGMTVPQATAKVKMAAIWEAMLMATAKAGKEIDPIVDEYLMRKFLRTDVAKFDPWGDEEPPQAGLEAA